MKYILLAILVTVAGCSKPNIVHIKSSDDIAKMELETVITSKDMSTEEKVHILTIKINEELERKKRAVESEKDTKLAAIINRPVTPLRTPDTVLRVLMLPYVDSLGVLNSWKYSFIKVDDGSWVLADYLNGTRPASKQMLTPLKPVKP